MTTGDFSPFLSSLPLFYLSAPAAFPTDYWIFIIRIIPIQTLSPLLLSLLLWYCRRWHFFACFVSARRRRSAPPPTSTPCGLQHSLRAIRPPTLGACFCDLHQLFPIGSEFSPTQRIEYSWWSVSSRLVGRARRRHKERILYDMFSFCVSLLNFRRDRPSYVGPTTHTNTQYWRGARSHFRPLG